MPFEIDLAAIQAFLSVILIDVVLSGDNAIVIGMAVAGLAPEKRTRIILLGIAAATLMRVLFAVIATKLLAIVGLTLAGGFLLLWVAWKMWRELRVQAQARAIGDSDDVVDAPPPPKTPRQAVLQIVLADLSMSLDNVLAVAGAARDHPEILIFGLVLSVALMAVAASFIARILDRFHWLAYVGLAIIAFVAVDMIHEGGNQVWDATEAGCQLPLLRDMLACPP